MTPAIVICDADLAGFGSALPFVHQQGKPRDTLCLLFFSIDSVSDGGDISNLCREQLERGSSFFLSSAFTAMTGKIEPFDGYDYMRLIYQ